MAETPDDSGSEFSAYLMSPLLAQEMRVHIDQL